MIEAFEGRLFLIFQPHGYQFTVVGLLLVLHDHDIPIIDQGINHRVSAHFEGVDALLFLDDVAGQFDALASKR